MSKNQTPVIPILAAICLLICFPFVAHAAGRCQRIFANVEPPRLEFNGQIYRVGDFVQFGSRALQYVKPLQSGRGREAHLMADAKGNQYVLKFSATQSLQDEWKILFPQLRKLGIKVPKVYVRGENYYLRQHTPGILGGEWVKQWQETGFDPKFPGYRELVRMYQTLARSKVYYGDLLPNNLTWDGQDWWIFDALLVDGVRPEDVTYTYAHELADVWSKNLPSLPRVEKLLRRAPKPR